MLERSVILSDISLTNTISKNIRKYRVEAQHTRYKMSALTGISYQVYAAYESGNRIPPIPKLQIIADVLNVPIYKLICEESELHTIETQPNQSVCEGGIVSIEHRSKHVVIKKDDINEYLSFSNQRNLYAMISEISTKRKLAGKNPENDYIVCNKDEPYAQYVLAIVLNGEIEKEKTLMEKENAL